MSMHITLTHFDNPRTTAYTERVVTQAEFEATMGAYAINGIEIESQWVADQMGGGGGTLVTTYIGGMHGIVHMMWYVTQRAVHTGIPG